MSEFGTHPTHHVKTRGRVRRCAWCGQRIEIGETYAKWLWYDGGERSTVYAHKECTEVWEEGEEGMMDGERPTVGASVVKL